MKVDKEVPFFFALGQAKIQFHASIENLGGLATQECCLYSATNKLKLLCYKLTGKDYADDLSPKPYSQQ
jgi:hypothetical protein